MRWAAQLYSLKAQQVLCHWPASQFRTSELYIRTTELRQILQTLDIFRLPRTNVADKVKGLEREYRRGADSVSRT